ncbi:MAG TPA: hypothetical protein VJ731_04850 [Terriglobales bacterium]|nr:hypothetical protein [Terriglobales bacterium]
MKARSNAALPIEIGVSNGQKLLPNAASVQLIVFVAAIREILKREIYGWDKKKVKSSQNAMKRKGEAKRQTHKSRGAMNLRNSVC